MMQERHFSTAHHPCGQPSCVAAKFVVFGSPLDLQAHMLDEHGSGMSARDRKEAVRVHADLAFQDVRGGRGGGRGRGRGGGGGTGRGRDPDPPPISQASSRGGRRAAFGAHLTPEGVPAPPAPSPPRPPSPDDDLDPELSPSDPPFLSPSLIIFFSGGRVAARAGPAVRSSLRAFRAHECSAQDVVSTLVSALDGERAASVVVGLVDALEDDEQRSDLLGAWNDWRLEVTRLSFHQRKKLFY